MLFKIEMYVDDFECKEGYTAKKVSVNKLMAKEFNIRIGSKLFFIVNDGKVSLCFPEDGNLVYEVVKLI